MTGAGLELRIATFWSIICCVLLFVGNGDHRRRLDTPVFSVLAVTATYMSLPAWSIPVLKSTLFQQTAPLIVIFLVPALLIWLSAHLRRIFLHNFTMGIESWGFSLPWLWSSSDPSSSTSRRKSKQKNSQSGATGSSSRHKAPRTHAEQIALNAVGENNASGMFALFLIIPLK
jgi:hypothetical protein